MRKPDSLLYGCDDKPPPGLLAALAMQHVLVLSIFLAAPVVVARAAALPLEEAGGVISMTMIGIAIGSLLQAGRWGPVGAGVLVIPTGQSAYIPGCVIAARLGGMPMVAGLLVMSGLLVVVLSRFLHRLRAMLPAESSGLIVLVTGIAIAQTGMADIVDSIVEGGGNRWGAPLFISLLTLGVMIACSVWGKGPLRTLGAVVGLSCGFAAAMTLGLSQAGSFDLIAQAALFQLPSLPSAWPSFDRGVLLPALVTGIAITLNAIGALTAAQQLNDADWKRQDIEGLSRGLFADGLGTMLTALIGGGGISASGTSVGLAANARATSRIIGYAVASGFAVMALMPKCAFLILAVPRPVLGAALLYLSCSLVIGGIAVMNSRLLDTRKTFTLGIAFAFAVATPTLTRAGGILPDWMLPVVGSPLLAAALVALVLNPILRIGIRQEVELSIPPEGLSYQEVASFVARAGALWGARRDVIDRIQGPIAECLDTLLDARLSRGQALLTLGFNELELDVRITWDGTPLMISATRPTKEELLVDDAAAARMAGYLIGRLANRVRSTSAAGAAELHLVFDH